MKFILTSVPGNGSLSSMLLVFPPVAKSGEPPAGVAKLAGALSANGVSCRILDMNIEGLLYLTGQLVAASDTWTRRAVRNIESSLSALRDSRTYRSRDRYDRAVKDISRVLAKSCPAGIVSGLADYQDGNLSPVRSVDLIHAAEHPEQNPFYPYFSTRLPEVIDKTFSPRRREGEREAAQVIGFSLNYLSQALCTFAMIGFVRREFPRATIILGGGLVSSWVKSPRWKNHFTGLVDRILPGPGEKPLLDLLGISDPELKHVTPDYAPLPLQAYLSPGFILPYSGSSGCYWNKCSFCPETAEDNPYVPVPAEQAMAELGELVKETKPVMAHLLDNAVSPALMRALAERPIGVPWYGFARISRDLSDLDYCMSLKRSGCRMLKLGLESGDQGVLDKMRKGIELETASRVLRNLHRAGIATYVYLLFGTPHETIDEARKTLGFVAGHRDAITFLNLAVFNMPVCGKEAGEYETGEFYDGDLSLYTGFQHPRGWNRKEVRRFLDQEFKRHPAVSMILKNDPPVFTSNHAAFFV